MPKIKGPVVGMTPFSEYARMEDSDDYSKSRINKALDVVGAGLGAAGVAAIPKRNVERKKEEPRKSGMELEIENARKDRRVKEEQEAYDKYDKTRLKDQGSFKKGGKVKSASSRADGIAQRGKTKGRMV